MKAERVYHVERDQLVSPRRILDTTAGAGIEKARTSSRARRRQKQRRSRKERRKRRRTRSRRQTGPT